MTNDDGGQSASDVLAALDALPAGQGSLVVDQVGEARRRLLEPARQLVRFGPDSLHNICRYLSPGQLWLVMSQSGIGKTTFALSAINDWVEAGVKVCLVPTELEDWEVRRDLACLRVGIRKAIASEGSWDEYPDGERWRHLVDDEIRKQASPPFSDHLMVLPIREISEEALLTSGRQAAEFGAQVLVIDHMDHADFSRKNTFALAASLARTAKLVAEENDLAVVGMKQVHSEAAKGDVLARYLPPELHQMQGGGGNAQNAVVVLGLYRPLKPVDTTEDIKRLKAVRAKVLDVTSVLLPNAMGVVVRKHRPDGSLEGRKCVLTVHNGRVTERVLT